MDFFASIRRLRTDLLRSALRLVERRVIALALVVRHVGVG
jgi:hypothetical protein